MWQIIHWDQTCQIKTQHQTGTYARGTTVLWNQYTDPTEGENLMKFIHETKTKYEEKIIQKQYNA